MNLNLDIFKIKTNNLSPQKGRVLIAEPFLPGSYFNRAIVLLVDHSAKGSVGFILNKPVDFPVLEFENEFPDFGEMLNIGGPVSADSIYYIHTLGDKIPGCFHIKDNIYWGGDFEKLKNMIKAGMVKHSDIRFFLGYSGWDAGQLQEELSEDSWLVSDIQPSLIMQLKQQLWIDMVKNLGGKYSLWENFPENPSMN
jgi:putative transcriptional regulator